MRFFCVDWNALRELRIMEHFLVYKKKFNPMKLIWKIRRVLRCKPIKCSTATPLTAPLLWKVMAARPMGVLFRQMHILTSVINVNNNLIVKLKDKSILIECTKSILEFSKMESVLSLLDKTSRGKTFQKEFKIKMTKTKYFLRTQCLKLMILTIKSNNLIRI